MNHSSLKAALAAKPAVSTAELTCIVVGSPTPGLLVECWQRESWLLPWSYLHSAQLTGTRTDAVLTLRFSTQTVTAHGHYLEPALLAAAEFKLERLRDLPEAYRLQWPSDTPFIARLTVTAPEAAASGPQKSAHHPKTLPPPAPL